MNRLERFEQLCEDEGLDYTRVTYSGAEDALEYINGEKPVGRWVLITRASENSGFVYAYHEETYQDVIERAGQYIGDSVFEELPVLVMNMDTGDYLWAEFEVRWVAADTDRRTL